MDEFKGKVAVVTGGASGIGRGVARALAKAGSDVLIADVDEVKAEKVAAELTGLGVRSQALRTDVTQTADVDRLADCATSDLGGVDILINNAGVYLGGPMADVTEDDWRWVFGVNVEGMFRVGQTFSRILRQQNRGGHVVNTASVGGFLSHDEGVAYSASKYAVVAYSEALRGNLEPLGIGVSTLCPGPIDTDLPQSDSRRPTGEAAGGQSEVLSQHIAGGMEPDAIGPIVVEGIRENAPYIFTHVDFAAPFQARFDAVMACFDKLKK